LIFCLGRHRFAPHKAQTSVSAENRHTRIAVFWARLTTAYGF